MALWGALATLLHPANMPGCNAASEAYPSKYSGWHRGSGSYRFGSSDSLAASHRAGRSTDGGIRLVSLFEVQQMEW